MQKVAVFQREVVYDLPIGALLKAHFFPRTNREYSRGPKSIAKTKDDCDIVEWGPALTLIADFASKELSAIVTKNAFA